MCSMLVMAWAVDSSFSATATNNSASAVPPVYRRQLPMAPSSNNSGKLQQWNSPLQTGIGGIGVQTTTTTPGGQIVGGQSSALGGPSGIHPSSQQQSGQGGGGISGGRRPKLSEKMKSLSLDCEGMPAPVQAGLGRNQYYKSKPIRSARGFANSGDSFEDALERSVSPPSGRPFRRLPPAPPQQQQQAIAPQSARLLPQANGGGNAATTASMMPAAALVAPSAQMPLATVVQSNGQMMPPSIGPSVTAITTTASSAATTPRALPIGTHVVIHEYIYGECQLYLGDRLVVVDNGDPDWKHGFRVNDRLEQLYTFPSTCVAAFQPQEQPMRLLQNCNLIEQKLRLYRDQVVFVQPNSLRDDGRVMIRNEHGTFAYCPLQFLMLM